ncbi:methyltransferase domain-containing protein [Virgibacillus sp. MSP4-1]|uniref:tRNA (mnm(5)s(2)U34)-methyltransferase n=1 Tax=Virgibacillus sp. MSP4-1 TaxID=2700081 RepID=UPI00039C4169|nr:class I SAM-dependent methyltransferase [Virgibacillus sp. MSP4-1]QHS23085.1 methyltransferase domain-containing protein [Virgibacillus sp. MSP4-1]
MVKQALQFSHELLKESVEKGDIVVDATAGNGNDTLFLANLVGETGHVLAFDIQEQAIQNTRHCLQEHHIEHATLIHDSHSQLDRHLETHMHKNIGGAIFNLGYLPGSDKSVITIPESTISAIHQLLEHLKKGKLIVLVVYYGHQGGDKEKEELLKMVKQLDQKKFSVLEYSFINQKNNPPFLLAIEKRKAR